MVVTFKFQGYNVLLRLSGASSGGSPCVSTVLSPMKDMGTVLGNACLGMEFLMTGVAEEPSMRTM